MLYSHHPVFKKYHYWISKPFHHIDLFTTKNQMLPLPSLFGYVLIILWYVDVNGTYDFSWVEAPGLCASRLCKPLQETFSMGFVWYLNHIFPAPTSPHLQHRHLILQNYKMHSNVTTVQNDFYTVSYFAAGCFRKFHSYRSGFLFYGTSYHQLNTS